MIKRLNPRYLARLTNTFCNVKLYNGLSEYGEPVVALELIDKKCRFSEKEKTVVDKDGKQVQLAGIAVFVGDIAPGMEIQDGEFAIGSRKYSIFGARRPRNPDRFYLSHNIGVDVR